MHQFPGDDPKDRAWGGPSINSEPYWPRNRPPIWPWILLVAVIIAVSLVFTMSPAHAEGETLEVVNLDCQHVTVRGDGYTPHQTLEIFVRAPQGEGTLTEVTEVEVNHDGEIPDTDLVFGGEVPDGTYQAVVTTPGPGQKEEVVEEFQVKGCLAGQQLLSASADCNVVRIAGTGFPQTDATVEALVLGEGEMIKQVFPNAQGQFYVEIPWSSPPLPGEHTAEVRIDNISKAETNFRVEDCSGSALPFTGTRNTTWLLAIAVALMGIGVLLLLLRRPRL